MNERTGVLLIRVWVADEPPKLRARILQRSDPAGPDHPVTVATTVDEVNAEVTRWLRTLLG